MGHHNYTPLIMVVTCPRCHRSLSSISGDAAPRFCMYCGQKLTDSAAPATNIHTATFTPQDPDDRSGQSSGADGPAPESHPEIVGGYRLLRLLGAGGMGTVYEAEAPQSGRRVAVKLLASRLAANPMSVERFRQEGRLASQISHPRCVFVLAADTDNGQPYIVMELMPGRTLKDLIDERGPLPPREAIARGLDIIDGLIEAHRLGMIHRDVKPSNCFLTADDRVKVGDFGLSKSLTSSANALTRTGTFLGTVLFASPEQIRGEPLDYTSDVYSVAATLYYLLCGEAPFQHESATAALAKAITEPPVRLRSKRPSVPAQLEWVIMRGLERDRARRWQTLDDFREALLNLQPERLRPARPRALVGAYLFDLLLVLVTLLFPQKVLYNALQIRQTDILGVDYNPVGWLLTILYFAIAEGFFGRTVGKTLFGLRVSRVGETGPPGFWRAFVRASIFAFIWLWILHGSQIAVRLVAAGEGAAGGFISLFVLGSGWAALAVQLRQKWHFRGLHDYASGCQVTQTPLPSQKLRLTIHHPTPLETHLPTTGDSLPETVGGYVIRARLTTEPTGEQVWLAEDRALARSVLLWLRPWGAEPTHDPARPTRLRRLGTGTIGWNGTAYDWTAYAAPLGGPLAEAVRPGQPLRWADARALLEQLTDEFRAAEQDGTLPKRLALDHIWVEPTGRLQVLDFPLCAARYRPNTPIGVLREAASLMIEGHPRSGTESVAAPIPAHALAVLNQLFAINVSLAEFQRALAETHLHRSEVTHAVRGAHLGIQAAALVLPLGLMLVITFLSGLYFAWMADVRAEQVRLASRAMTDPEQRVRYTLGHPAVEQALNSPRLPLRLEDLGVRTRNEAKHRREHLIIIHERLFIELQRYPPPDADRTAGYPDAVRQVILWAGASEKSPQGQDAAPWKSLAEDVMAVFLLIPVSMVVAAAATRGGMSMMLAGIVVVGSDGRPASRSRCALRAAVVWLPITALLFGSVLLQAYAPGESLLAAGLWLAALMLLPVYVFVALRNPSRPPQDRLTGTYLVPV